MNRILMTLLTEGGAVGGGYKASVALSMVMALNNRAKYTSQVKEDLTILRFIYELTGRGQKYVNTYEWLNK